MSSTFKSFKIPTKLTISLNATEMKGLSNIQDLARKALTVATRRARKKALPIIYSLILDSIMNHPDVRNLSSGTDLAAALGLANASEIRGLIKGSLSSNIIGPHRPREAAGISNKLPESNFGITQKGIDSFSQESFGSYISHNKKRNRGKGKSYEIPWLRWMLFKDQGRVHGFHVKKGDYPKSRTGDAIMSLGGSFAIGRWTSGNPDFITESIRGLEGRIYEIYTEILQLELSNVKAEARPSVIADVASQASTGPEVSEMERFENFVTEVIGLAADKGIELTREFINELRSSPNTEAAMTSLSRYMDKRA
jgi:hypothetical protein